MFVRDRITFDDGSVARARAACVAVVVSLLASCGRTDIRPAEFSTTLPVGGSKTPAIEYELARGVYTVEARERDIDLHLRIDAPNASLELEDSVWRHGLLVSVVRISARDKVRIGVRSTDHSGKSGEAVIAIRKLTSDPDAAASELELGYREFGVASVQTAGNRPQSWTLAADSLLRAIGHFRATRESAALAQAEYSLACLQYMVRENWDGAVRAATDASETYQSRGDELGVQRAAMLRAAAELEIASNASAEAQRAEQRALYEAAERRLERAAAYFSTHDLPIDLQFAIQLRGIRYMYVGDDGIAWKYFSRAEALARENHDPGEVAKSLNNLAVIDQRHGRVTRAAREFEKLLPLIEPHQEDMYALAIGNYALCLIALGDFDRALALHTEAMRVYAARGDDQMRARQLAAIGGVYFRRGDFVRSLDALRAAIALQELGGDGSGRAQALRIAGNAAAELGQHALALNYLRQSRSLDSSPLLVARTRVLIAGELRELGDFGGAHAELDEALEVPDDFSQANALLERARLSRSQHDLPAAMADLRVADQLFSKLALDFNRIDSNTLLSKLALDGGDAAAALSAADTAVALASRIRVKSANPEWRARFLSSRYSPFEARISALLAKARPDDGTAIWNAFLAAEEVRARSMKDRLLEANAPHADDTDATAGALQSRLTALQLRLDSRLARSDVDQSGTIELQRAIQETRAEIDANWLRIRGSRASSTPASAFSGTLDEVQSALPAGSAVLAYFVGDEASYAWLLTRNSLRYAQLGGRAELQRIADAFIGAQRGKSAALTKSSMKRSILADLLDDVRETRLLVITDGPLNGLPFAALSLGNGRAQQMVIDRFVVGYAPSLALALQPEPRIGPSTNRVAVISDPVYAADDRRLILASAGQDSTSYRGPPVPQPDDLTRLPYSALEAKAVVRAFGGRSVMELRGFEANAERVKALSASALDVLHFATHASASKDAPEESALYLSGYAANGKSLAQRRLTLHELTQTGLHANLVVLSGCATGDGSELRGEGVLGLTYGFLANGSRAVVASLWPIQDASTATFMDEFYRAYRNSGRASDALREAQMRLRDRAPPAVWSSFVVRANQFP